MFPNTGLAPAPKQVSDFKDKLKGLKDREFKDEKFKKFKQKIDQVKGLYETARNLYDRETRTSEIVKICYERLQKLAGSVPAASFYLKWHEEHIGRLRKALQSREAADMAMEAFRESIELSNELEKRKAFLLQKYDFARQMTDGNGVRSHAVDRIRAFKDYYRYRDNPEMVREYYRLQNSRSSGSKQDRRYNQAAMGLYEREISVRARNAGEQIVDIAGEVTAAYLVFTRDYRILRNNAREVSGRLKKLLDGKVTDWKAMDRVMGLGATKQLMEEAFGSGNDKAFEAIRHYAWGDPLDSLAIRKARHAAADLGSLAHDWLAWSYLFYEAGDDDYFLLMY